eukprot:10215074-Prorocentrum_lima.AAC.1
MTSSLVGSEMCIRDSLMTADDFCLLTVKMRHSSARSFRGHLSNQCAIYGCLLYTSDAADDM